MFDRRYASAIRVHRTPARIRHPGHRPGRARARAGAGARRRDRDRRCGGGARCAARATRGNDRAERFGGGPARDSVDGGAKLHRRSVERRQTNLKNVVYDRIRTDVPRGTPAPPRAPGDPRHMLGPGAGTASTRARHAPCGTGAPGPRDGVVCPVVRERAAARTPTGRAGRWGGPGPGERYTRGKRREPRRRDVVPRYRRR